MSTRRTSPRKKPPLTRQPSTASLAAPTASQDAEDHADAADLSDEQLSEEAETTTTLADASEPDTRPQSLPPRDPKPPKLFILPSPLHPDSRILTLPCPATADATRYLADPSGGLHEFTRVAAGPGEPRSILLTPVRSAGEEEGLEEELLRLRELDLRAEEVQGVQRGYVGEKSELFVATPVDPVFLLLPLLERAGRKGEGGKRLFVAFDEYVEEAGDGMHFLLGWEGMRRRLEARIGAVCEALDAGGEMMYRFSEEKLAALLVGKARRMVQHGLPESLEQHFVRQPLQPPLMSVKREETESSQMSEANAEGGAEATQDIQMTDVPAVDDKAVQSTPAPPSSASPEVIQLLRLRTSLRLLSSRYLPPELTTRMQALFAKLIDFTPLDTHLSELERLRAEASALSSMAVDLAQKRGAGFEDDEEAAERAEKRRRKEEEEERKKKKERARKGLGKVDVTGMAKMSSFFKPMAGAKAKKKDAM